MSYMITDEMLELLNVPKKVAFISNKEELFQFKISSFEIKCVL